MAESTKQLSLGEAAKYDHANKLKFKLTAWAMRSNQRRIAGVSRRLRILARKMG